MIALALASVVTTLALGAFSSLIFVWTWLVTAPTRLSAAVLLAVVTTLAVRLFLYLNRRVPPLSSPPSGLAMPLVIAGAVVAYWLVLCSVANPLGRLDAAAIWNLHARFLYRGVGGTWKQVFDSTLFWSHNDYPLLLSGLVQGAWVMAGSEHTIWPEIIAMVFGGAAVATVASATCVYTRDSRGWLLALILLMTPSFVLQWPNQMADVPLSVYMLTAVVLIQFAELWPNLRNPLLMLAGLSAGYAAWTKNEGLLFVVALFASRGLAVLILTAWRARAPTVDATGPFRRTASMIALGLVPIGVLVIAFKLFLAPPGDMTLNAAALARFGDFARYRQIAFAFLSDFVKLGEAIAVGGTHPGILLALFLLLYGGRIRQVSVTSLHLLFIPVMMLAGHFLVYVITPHPLDWHLRTSFPRLLLQLWPMVLFILATVEVAMTARPASLGTERNAVSPGRRAARGSPIAAGATNAAASSQG